MLANGRFFCGEMLAFMNGTQTGSNIHAYQMKVFFQNVEDQIDISGAFQYGATVRGDLEPGKKYELKDVPGGPLSFTVASDTIGGDSAGYNVSLIGNSGGPTAYYWYAQLSRSKDEKNEQFPYQELTITSPDALGVWINEYDEGNMGIFDAYGDNTGPGFNVYVTYTTQDEKGNNKVDAIHATSGDVTRDAYGTTTVSFKGTQEDFQLDVRFERSDYVPGTWGVYDSSGRMTYITRMFTSGISISEFSTGG